MKTLELTEKQARFAQEYIVDLNAKQAYLRAGYEASPVTAGVNGYKLLKLPHVAAAVQKAMDKRRDDAGIKPDYVLKTIIDTIERCSQAVPVKDRNGQQVFVKTKSGDVVPAYTFDANAVLKGTELLGKHLKLFTNTEKVEHTGANGGPIEVQLAPELTKEEWLKAHGIGQNID